MWVGIVCASTSAPVAARIQVVTASIFSYNFLVIMDEGGRDNNVVWTVIASFFLAHFGGIILNNAVTDARLRQALLRCLIVARAS